MSEPEYNIQLAEQRRGTEFRYHFTLGNGWTVSMLTGGIKFTLRKELPASSVTNDDDAVDQASLANGEITFSDDTHGMVLIPASRTTFWPAPEDLFWDLQGQVTIGARVLDIAAGTIPVRPDVTRSQ